MFLRGAGMTLLISIIGTIFGAIIGLLQGLFVQFQCLNEEQKESS